MTYPQSGGYGYGQNPQGGQDPQQYGQQAQQGQYGQQYQAGQYGQQAQQQYGQAQYGQQDQYGQAQYGDQAQYGYGAPQQPKAPQQLPATTPKILAAVIGGLGVITLFCGFLTGSSITAGAGRYSSTYSQKLFSTEFSVPYGLLAVAALIALVSLILGAEKWVVGTVFSLTVVSVLVTIFQFSTNQADNGAGAIVLLITSILAAIAAVVWLLIEGGQLKLADATATAAAGVAAPAVDTSAQAAAQPAAAGYEASSGYGYGQQAAQTPAAQTPAAEATTQYGQGQYGQYAPTQYGAQTSTPAATGSDATTAFPKPSTDPGSATPQSEQQ